MLKLYVTIIIKPGICKNKTWLDYYLWAVVMNLLKPSGNTVHIFNNPRYVPGLFNVL